MKIKFTRLACVGIAAFCMFSVTAQKSISQIEKTEGSVSKIGGAKFFTGNKDMDYHWPDSAITYHYSGNPVSKNFYSKENKTAVYAELVKGNWVTYAPSASDGFSFYKPKVSFYDYNETHYLFDAPSIIRNTSFLSEKNQTTKYNMEYDDKENLVLLEYSTTYNSKPYWILKIKYNENNDPVLIDFYDNNYNFLREKERYEYNSKNQITLMEYLFNDKTRFVTKYKDIAEYDENGRPVAAYQYHYNETLDKLVLNKYQLFYYSDKAVIHNIELTDHNAVGSNNQGHFTLTFNLPSDSIQNGSLTINLPDGFTLDVANTSLSIDLAALFDLSITKKENNAWVMEVKPGLSKATMIKAEEISQLLNVAYKVDENITKDIYDIAIDNILFETKTGNYVPEPVITIPVSVNRWAVGNEKVTASGAVAYISGNILYLQTLQAELVSVYTIQGSKVYEAHAEPGIKEINVGNLPKGVLIVKGNSGWVKKVIHY